MCAHLFLILTYWPWPKNGSPVLRNKPARSLVQSISFCFHQLNIEKQLEIDHINPNVACHFNSADICSWMRTTSVACWTQNFAKRTVSNRDFNGECFVKMMPIKKHWSLKQYQMWANTKQSLVGPKTNSNVFALSRCNGIPIQRMDFFRILVLCAWEHFPNFS